MTDNKPVKTSGLNPVKFGVFTAATRSIGCLFVKMVIPDRDVEELMFIICWPEV